MIAALKKGKSSSKTGISERMSKNKKRVSKTECQKVNSTNIGRHIQRDPITIIWLCCILNFFREQSN